jgi:histone acetyltransferase (RNA polymerase elongator complex component)
LVATFLRLEVLSKLEVTIGVNVRNYYRKLLIETSMHG